MRSDGRVRHWVDQVGQIDVLPSSDRLIPRGLPVDVRGIDVRGVSASLSSEVAFVKVLAYPRCGGVLSLNPVRGVGAIEMKKGQARLVARQGEVLDYYVAEDCGVKGRHVHGVLRRIPEERYSTIDLSNGGRWVRVDFAGRLRSASLGLRIEGLVVEIGRVAHGASESFWIPHDATSLVLKYGAESKDVPVVPGASRMQVDM